MPWFSSYLALLAPFIIMRDILNQNTKNSLSFNGALPNREGLTGCPVSQFAPSYPGDDCRLLLLNYYNI